MRWRTRGLITAAMVAAITGAGSLLAQEPVPIGAVDLKLSDTHFALRPRAERAAAEAAARYGEWLGQPAGSPLTLTDQPRGRVFSPWSSPATMDIEAAVAYGVAHQWWGSPSAADAFVVHGICWYLQSRIVERLFDFTFQHVAYRGDAVSFFAGSIPYGFSNLRLGRLVSGVGRGELLFERSDRTWPRAFTPLPPEVDHAALRVALALTSIEHVIGWPVLQGALSEASRRAREGPMPLSRLGQILDAASGVSASRSLDWYQQQSRADIAIERVTSEPCKGEGCVRTRVMVKGGTALPQAVAIKVTLADGQQVDMVWDGASSTTFEVEGPAPASGVELDPDRIDMLDTNFLDNQFQPAAPTNAPLTKWMTRWIVWLQDGMLAYSSLF